MPYADNDVKKSVMRIQYVARYHTEDGFKEREAKRKQAWYEANKERLIAKALARRAELRGAK